MRKSNTSLIIRGIMLLLALIIMVFVGTQAWFSETRPYVDATGLSAQAKGSAEVDIAVGFKTSVNGYQYTISNYDKDLNLRKVMVGTTEYDAMHDFSPLDVTGDGVTLIRPTMQTKNKDIDRDSVLYKTVTPNKEYISFDMYFRSTEPCKVYLDEESYVIGGVEEEVGDGNLIQDTLTDYNRKAEEGNYSCDAVVGAVRVAFVGYSQVIEGEDIENRDTTPTLLWLPRPDVHLNTSGPTGEWSLSTGVQPGEYIDTYGDMDCDTYTHHYYAFVNGRGTDINYADTVVKTNTDVICEVGGEKIGDYYYGKTQCNIWIEGCDTEARRTIAGGKFLVNFDLTAG